MDTSNSAKVNIARLDHDRRSVSPGKRCQSSSVSTALSDALHQPSVLERPQTLACRVNHAGKEFLKHNQTCHWIQYMIEEEPQPPRPGPRIVKPRPQGPSSVKPSPPLSDMGQISIPDLSPSLPDVGSCEEQLQTLQRQQGELMEQQRRLQQQIEQYKKAHLLPSQQQDHLQRHCTAQASEYPLRGSTTSVVTSDNLTPPIPNRRRLKGNLAQTCAIRDEGSIGSILWHSDTIDCADRKRNRTPSKLDHSVLDSRSDVEDRQTAKDKEVDCSVSQLLCHLPCQYCREVSQDISEMSVTLLAEPPVEDRSADCYGEKQDGHFNE